MESFRETMDAAPDFAAVRLSLLDLMRSEAWDPLHTLKPMLVRLALNASATFDRGDTAAGRPASGGSTNCGLGGATMRFEPEASDPQNAGLLGAASELSARMVVLYPTLSHADLWVLAAYAAVEALGGPTIPFTGGRFDAKEGMPKERVPCGDGPRSAQNPHGSRLPPLDEDPLPVGPGEGCVPRGTPTEERERPAVEALRRCAGRLGLSDREVVCLLVGCRGQKRGAPGLDGNGGCWGAAWAETKSSFGARFSRQLLGEGPCHWVEVRAGTAQRGTFHDCLRPAAHTRARHFVSLGQGYEGVVVEGCAGVTVSPVSTVDLEANGSDIDNDPRFAGLDRIRAGETFRFVSKKMSYHRLLSEEEAAAAGRREEAPTATTAATAVAPRGKVGQVGVITYELSGGEGWVHDFDPSAPARRLVKFHAHAAVSGMPKQMAHAQDMALVWDDGFRHWLRFYADGSEGSDRLAEDFAVAFRRITELGFNPYAAVTPTYPEPVA